MIKVIEFWIRKKAPKLLVRQIVTGNAVKHSLLDFVGQDGKYYCCSVLFDDYRIYGVPGSKYVKKLQSFSNHTGIAEDDVSLFDILDANTVSFENKQDWVKNRPLPLDETKLNNESLSRCQEVLDAIFNINNGVFKVVLVELISIREVCVHFATRGHMYAPLRLNVGDPSLVRVRRYKGSSESFKDFVTEITNITGGVYWIEED